MTKHTNIDAHTTLVWEDPPERPQRAEGGPPNKGIWVQRLAPLKERPGQWARVYYGPYGTASGSASGLRRGKFHGINTPGEQYWEFESRKDPINTDRGSMYARYVGPTNGQISSAQTGS